MLKPFFLTDPIWLLLADPSMIRPPNCFWLELLKMISNPSLTPTLLHNFVQISYNWQLISPKW